MNGFRARSARATGWVDCLFTELSCVRSTVYLVVMCTKGVYWIPYLTVCLPKRAHWTLLVYLRVFTEQCLLNCVLNSVYWTLFVYLRVFTELFMELFVYWTVHWTVYCTIHWTVHWTVCWTVCWTVHWTDYWTVNWTVYWAVYWTVYWTVCWIAHTCSILQPCFGFWDPISPPYLQHFTIFTTFHNILPYLTTYISDLQHSSSACQNHTPQLDLPHFTTFYHILPRKLHFYNTHHIDLFVSKNIQTIFVIKKSKRKPHHILFKHKSTHMFHKKVKK